MERGMRIELGSGYLVHKRNVSSVKWAEFVSDRRAYIILRGRWWWLD
jgi:hypothetical protein